LTDLAITFDADINVLNFSAAVSSGDLATDDGLHAAVLYSLFTDKRAGTDDDIPDATDDPRGHWADSVLGESEGSHLWLLTREKQTQQTLNRAQDYAREALQWLIDDGHASRVEVIGEWLRLGVLALQITIWSGDQVRFSNTLNLG
jgi:phage gp46-like protein